MKASVMTAPGGPEVLKLQDLPDPTLNLDTDVLVRVKAAGVNPVDTKMRAKPSAYPVPLTNVLGCDGAGIVEAVGKAVKDFKPGDAVYYSQPPMRGRLGNYAQKAVIDYRLIAKKPEKFSFEEAAAAPLVLITAWESLHDRAQVKRGDKVLIHAGAGGVGHVAIQLARIAGAEVATTVGTRENAKFVTTLGAQRAIFYKEDDFAAAALEWTGGRGVDVAFDTVGGKTFTDSFAAVRYAGDLVTLLQPGADVDWTVARVRNLRVSFELMLIPVALGLTEEMAHHGEILRRCAALIDQGQLRVHVGKVLPLAQADAAHALLLAGNMTGKIVLAID